MQVPVVERLALYFNELVVNSQDVCPDTEIHKVRGFSPDPQGAMNESSLLSVLREAVFSGTPSMKTILNRCRHQNWSLLQQSSVHVFR
jgi:hypothetical protein